MTYPQYVDGNVIRSVALSTFFISLIVLLDKVNLLQLQITWLILPLFVDFLLRLIHPKFSPLVQFNMLIGQRFLKIGPNQHFSAPKRFAIFIGTTLTGLMVISEVFQLFEFFLVLNLFLLFAAYLQGFFGYCLGCEIYNLLIKFKIIKSQVTVN